MISAVIPVKRLSEGKSRLASRLSLDERAGLMTSLLRRTISVLKEVDSIGRIGVTTEERALVDSLTEVDWLPDLGGLNASLTHAAFWAETVNATSVLILPCDLPLLDRSDIHVLLESKPGVPSITIASTQDGGTGAILISPPRAIAPLFGPDSFRRHIEAARSARIAVQTVARSGFAHDVDTADDLAYVEAHTTDLGCITT